MFIYLHEFMNENRQTGSIHIADRRNVMTYDIAVNPYIINPWYDHESPVSVILKTGFYLTYSKGVLLKNCVSVGVFNVCMCVCVCVCVFVFVCPETKSFACVQACTRVSNLSYHQTRSHSSMHT